MIDEMTRSRRDGVRRRRKLASRRDDTNQHEPTLPTLPTLPTPAPCSGSGPSPGSPAKRAGRPDGFIAHSSIMSYDSVSEPIMHDGLPTRIVQARDAILAATEADLLPPPALLQALKDSFVEHVLPQYPVVDPGDLSDPNASILLQQAVCLAGSLMRHDQNSLQLGYSQYEKVKTLLHIDYEHDKLALLKTFCLLSCWSPASPYLVTLDGPWHWTGMAVRLATQMGLQKQSTYSNHERAGCFRRIFWHLRVCPPFPWNPQSCFFSAATSMPTSKHPLHSFLVNYVAKWYL